MRYLIRKALKVPALDHGWDDGAWRKISSASISHFRPESSNHRPHTSVKLQYDKSGIYGQFKVRDKYVKSTVRRFQSQVCKDSCVEFFVKPKNNSGYFNFEFNCTGTLLVYYIMDHRKVDGKFRRKIKLRATDKNKMRIISSLPSKFRGEMEDPLTWYLSFCIPFSVLEKYCGKIGPVAGKTWTGNFYKCGDQTSHPHWAAWSPVSAFNFHLPECFGDLRFE